MVPRCATLLKHARLLHESYNENDDTITKLERAFSVFTFDDGRNKIFACFERYSCLTPLELKCFSRGQKTDYPVFVLSRTHLMTSI